MGKKPLPTDENKDSEILTMMAHRIIELDPQCDRCCIRSECVKNKVLRSQKVTGGSLLASATYLAEKILAVDPNCKKCANKSDSCVFRIVRFYVSGFGMASGKECVKK